jgi:hypothetical protein
MFLITPGTRWRTEEKAFLRVYLGASSGVIALHDTLSWPMFETNLTKMSILFVS